MSIPTEFKGNCLGVRIHSSDAGAIAASKGKDYQQITLLVEDDEFWSEKLTVGSYWLDELLEVLQLARRHLRDNYVKEDYGYTKRKPKQRKPKQRKPKKSRR